MLRTFCRLRNNIFSEEKLNNRIPFSSKKLSLHIKIYTFLYASNADIRVFELAQITWFRNSTSFNEEGIIANNLGIIKCINAFQQLPFSFLLCIWVRHNGTSYPIYIIFDC